MKPTFGFFTQPSVTMPNLIPAQTTIIIYDGVCLFVCFYFTAPQYHGNGKDWIAIDVSHFGSNLRKYWKILQCKHTRQEVAGTFLTNLTLVNRVGPMFQSRDPCQNIL